MRRWIAAALGSAAAACSGGDSQPGRTIATPAGAFLTRGSLRVVQADPLDSALIADDFVAWGWFDFSEDGRWLAYFREGSSHRYAIEIVPATGGQPVSVVDADPLGWWAPGPARLAFTRTRPSGGPRELWVVSPGEAPVRITDVLAAQGSDCGQMQAFSPDGSQIAWLEDTAGNGELRLVVASPGGARRELVRPAPGSAVRVFLWSPDGTRLAYGTNLPPHEGTTGSFVWSVADASSGTSVPLGSGGAVRWSPDGSRLFQVRERNDGTPFSEDLHESAGDGTGDRIVAGADIAIVDWARWNPRGGSIAFATGLSAPGTPLRDKLFTVVPGSPALALRDLVAGDSGQRPLVSWSPDGAWLVVVRNDLTNGNQALVLETADGATRLAPLGAAGGAVRTFGWSNDGRLAYVVSTFPGASSASPGGRAFAWSPSGSPVEVTAQGALIEQLEWTRGGALIGAGSRRTGPDTYDSPLFVWPSARGEAVEVVKDAVSFHAAHRHPDLFAAFDCR